MESIVTGSTIDPRALGGVSGKAYQESNNPNFLIRARAESEWADRRLSYGLDSYQCYTTGKISRNSKRAMRFGILKSGLNFGSQDYLSLSAHPDLLEAAKRVIDIYGVHSAGSAGLAGISDIALELEKELATFTGYLDTILFPIGWAAGYGVITSLVRPDDHIVIDVLAHACLQEGAQSATNNVHRFPHLSTDGIARRLKRIRVKNKNAGILVVTESLFSMDSDTPDIVAIQNVCKQYEATLLVDVAHDLGAMGQTGRGILEDQELIGKVDILMGTFSKSFASIGGFVASNETGLKIRLRFGCGPSTFTNAMSPIQVGILRKALKIVQSKEGSERRARLMKNILLMRKRLSKEGFEVLGQPSPIIPVILGGPALSRLMTKFANENGGFVNLVEYPAVPRNSCRWRIQMMADHTDEDIESFVRIVVKARSRAVDVTNSEVATTR